MVFDFPALLIVGSASCSQDRLEKLQAARQRQVSTRDQNAAAHAALASVVLVGARARQLGGSTLAAVFVLVAGHLLCTRREAIGVCTQACSALLVPAYHVHCLVLTWSSY